MKKYNKKILMYILLLIIVSTLIAIMNGVQPVITKMIIDALINSQNELSFLFIALLMSIFVLLGTELTNKTLYIMFNRYITNFFRNKSINKILSMNSKTFTTLLPEEYTSMINNELPEVIENSYILLPNIYFQGVSLLIYSSVVLFINIPLGIIILFSNILSILIPKLFRSKLEKRKTSYVHSLRNINIILNEILEGFQEIRRSMISHKKETDMLLTSSKSLTLKYKYEMMKTCSEVLIGLILFISTFLILFLGSIYISRGDMSIGGLIAIIQISELISGPLIGFTIDLGIYYSNIELRNEYIDRFEIFNNTVVYEKNVYAETIEKITFENVSFSYDGKKNIIDSFNYIFNEGHNYQIVGKNGSGKSSLVKILTKELEPNKGLVKINSKFLTDVGDNVLFKSIGYASQNPFLFNSTIKDNIVMENKYDEKKLLEIMSIVNLDKEIIDVRLSDLNNTNNTLSGGEKQKVSIARILYSNKKWIIFDEAMSNIEHDSFSKIERYLLNHEKITFIHITHQKSEERYDYIINQEWS